jgi:glycosyltransferase involved in cell wall biosynthesis
MGSQRQLHVHALVDSLGFGGAEALVPEFAAVSRAVGIDLSVGYLKELDGGPAAARLRRQGIEPTLVPIFDINPSAVWQVRRHVASIGPDLVHTHLWNSDLLGGLAARSLKVPAVSTIHTLEWQSDTLPYRVKTRLAAWVRRRCAARVLTVSESARHRYLEAGWDVSERVRTLRNGVLGRADPGAGTAVRASLGLGPEHLVAAMLSALTLRKKGHDVAVSAVRELHEQFPQLRLLIVGGGPDRAAIARAAAALGDIVVLPGYRDDVMAVLDATDVLIHPSRTDAFPTTVLEAMAASVPVVATAVGGIPEMVHDGVTGVLFEPPPAPELLAGSLAPLLGDGELRRRLGAGGRKRFEREFRAERWAGELRAEYESVLEDCNWGSARAA